MKYRKRPYEYQLEEPERFKTGIYGYNFDTKYFSMEEHGIVTVKVLYAWDGCSGPTIDDEDKKINQGGKESRTAVPSLRHDVKYQMLRLGLIPLSYKGLIDREFHDDLIERGFNPLRADIWHMGVHFGGASSCQPGTDDDNIMEAH